MPSSYGFFSWILQSNILAVLDSIDLLVPGSSSLLLKDLAYFVTLAFSGTVRSPVVNAPPEGRIKSRPLTYIALCKRVMPLLAHMYSRFKGSSDIYADGTVGAILAVRTGIHCVLLANIETLGIRYTNQA